MSRFEGMPSTSDKLASIPEVPAGGEVSEVIKGSTPDKTFIEKYIYDPAPAQFDVGTGDNISLNEMKEIVNEYHPNVTFDYIDPRPGDVLLTKAKTDSLKQLGWQVEMTIKNGIKHCFNF